MFTMPTCFIYFSNFTQRTSMSPPKKELGKVEEKTSNSRHVYFSGIFLRWSDTTDDAYKTRTFPVKLDMSDCTIMLMALELTFWDIRLNNLRSFEVRTVIFQRHSWSMLPCSLVHPRNARFLRENLIFQSSVRGTHGRALSKVAEVNETGRHSEHVSSCGTVQNVSL